MVSQRLSVFLGALLFVVSGLPAPLGAAQDGAAPSSKSLRLYAVEEGRKRYFNGYDWIQFDLNQKIALVEKARQGAILLHAMMLKPAEVYVRELDRMYGETNEVRLIEVGQAIQGIAITLKDWNDGGDPDQKIKDALGR
jgi:hypothetical protein